MRQRERLVEYAAAYIQHMQNALMEMNLPLHYVVSDITGATGMRIIRAIVTGERDPEVLASLPDKARTMHRAKSTPLRGMCGPLYMAFWKRTSPNSMGLALRWH